MTTKALFLLFASAFLALPASDWQKTDPKQWSGDDVYQILHNSPWSKIVKTSFVNPKDSQDPLGQSGGSGTPGGTWGNSGQMPGMGRRGGMGGGGTRGYGGSSGGGSRPSNPAPSSPTEVTIQWQSAVPVQLAAAKKADTNADTSGIKPPDIYVIAVIGLPVSALGGRAASVDSDQTLDPDEARQIAERLKATAELTAGGKQTLHPLKVELDQGADGRTLFYFPKTDPITLAEKTAEFKLVAGHTKVEKKFTLKDMQYQGQLAL